MTARCHPWKKGEPGRACCATTCCLFSTEFDAQSEYDDAFTIDAPPGESTGGQPAPTGLTWTAGQVAQAGAGLSWIADPIHPDDPFPSRACAMVSGSTAFSDVTAGDGSVARVMINGPTFSGSGGYLAADLLVGSTCGQLQIRLFASREASTGTLLANTPVPGAVSGQFHRLCICFDPDTDTAYAYVEPFGTDEVYETATSDPAALAEFSPGPVAGFGAAADSAGTVTIDAFEFHRLWYYAPPAVDCATVYFANLARGIPANTNERWQIDLTACPNVPYWIDLREPPGDTEAVATFSMSPNDTLAAIQAQIDAAVYSLENTATATVTRDTTATYTFEFGGSWGSAAIFTNGPAFSLPGCAVLNNTQEGAGADGINERWHLRPSGGPTDEYLLVLSPEDKPGTDIGPQATTATLRVNSTAAQIAAAISDALNAAGNTTGEQCTVTETAADPLTYEIEFTGDHAQHPFKQSPDTTTSWTNACAPAWGYDNPQPKIYCAPCYSNRCNWAVGHFSDDGFRLCEWLGSAYGSHPEKWSTDTTAGTLHTDQAALILHASQYHQYRRAALTYPSPDGWLTYQAPGYRHTLRVSFTPTAASTVAAIVAAGDADNYLALVLSFGAGSTGQIGSAGLLEVSDGTPRALGPSHTIRDMTAGREYYAVIEYDNGRLAAAFGAHPQILRYSYTMGDSPENSFDLAAWGKELRDYPDDAPVYGGPHVGFSVVGTSGSVALSGFSAGCHGRPESCRLDEYGLDHLAPGWITEGWIKTAGEWPLSVSNPTDGTHVITDGDPFSMLAGNPVDGDAIDSNTTTALFLPVSEDTLDTGDSWGLIFGSDDSAANHYRIQVDCTGRIDDAAPWGPVGTTKLIKHEGGTDETLAQSTAFPFYGLTACLTGGLISAQNGALWKGGTDGAFGPYFGAFATPANTEIKLRSLKAQRNGGINTANPYTRAGCGGCYTDCSLCEDEQFPARWYFELTGLESYQTDVSFFNGGYYVEATGNTCIATGAYLPPELIYTGPRYPSCYTYYRDYPNLPPLFQNTLWTTDPDWTTWEGATMPLGATLGLYLLSYNSWLWSRIYNYTPTKPYGLFLQFSAKLSTYGNTIATRNNYHTLLYGLELDASEIPYACRSVDQLRLPFLGTTNMSIDYGANDLYAFAPGCNYSDFGWLWGKAPPVDSLADSSGTYYTPSSDSYVLLSVL